MQWGRKGLKGALNSWKQMLLSDQIASNRQVFHLYPWLLPK